MLKTITLLLGLSLALTSTVSARESQFILEYGKAQREYDRRVTDQEKVSGKQLTPVQRRALYKDTFADVKKAWNSDLRDLGRGLFAVGLKLKASLLLNKFLPGKGAPASPMAAAKNSERVPASASARSAPSNDGPVTPGTADNVSFGIAPPKPAGK